jgi:hypothetical protein
MTDLRKAAEMALERLESHEYWMDDEAIKALRQALAQTGQEPVVDGLFNELLDVVHKYHGTMVLATALGCLEMVKTQLVQEHTEEDEDDE